MRIASLGCLGLLLAGCAVTETGNPEGRGIVIQAVRSSEPSLLSIGVDGGRLVIDRIWESVTALRATKARDPSRVPSRSPCEGAGNVFDESLEFVAQGAGVTEILSSEQEIGFLAPHAPLLYCQLAYEHVDAQSPLPAQAPAQLEGAALVIEAHLGGGTAVRIGLRQADLQGLSRLRGAIPVASGENRYLSILQLNATLVQLLESSAQRGDNGSITVDDQHNAALRRQVASKLSRVLYLDADGDGVVGGADQRVAATQANLSTTAGSVQSLTWGGSLFYPEALALFETETHVVGASREEHQSAQSDIAWVRLDGSNSAEPVRRQVFESVDIGTRWFHEGAEAVAIDSSGNAYIAGMLSSPANLGADPLRYTGYGDIFVASYDRQGKLRWSRSYGTATQLDRALGLTTDSEGNVYVTGESGGRFDFGGGMSGINDTSGVFLLSLDSEGSYRWSKVFRGARPSRGRDVAIDKADRGLYLVGDFESPELDLGGGPLHNAGEHAVFVASYDWQGNHRWSRKLDGRGSLIQGTSIDVDQRGNVVVLGSFFKSVLSDTPFALAVPDAGTSNILLASLSAQDGDLRWAQRFGGTAAPVPGDLALDQRGNIYITGSFKGTAHFGGAEFDATSEDIYIASLTDAGVHRWSIQLGGPDDGDKATAIAVAHSGRVHIAGTVPRTTDLKSSASPSPTGESLDSSRSHFFLLSREQTGQAE